MARKTKPQYDQTLMTFCEKPATALNKNNDDSYKFFSNGKTFKVVPAGFIPSSVTWLPNQLDGFTRAGSARNGGKTGKLKNGTINPAQITKLLQHMKEDKTIIINTDNGPFGIVHESVELLKPDAQPTTDFKAAATPDDDNAPAIETKPEEPQTDVEEHVSSLEAPSTNIEEIEETPDPIEEELADLESDVDVEKIEIHQATEISYDTYGFREFSGTTRAQQNKPYAYDHVVDNKNIAVVSYKGRTKPIGFMLPYETLNGNEFSTTARHKISHVLKTMKGTWATDPLKSDIFTIEHQSKAPIIFVTMGAALELRTKGLFDNAPDWVQAHLNQAQVDQTARLKALAGLQEEQRKDVTPRPETYTKGKLDSKPTASSSRPENPATVKAPETTTTASNNNVADNKPDQIQNALQAVTKALAAAQRTDALIKVQLAGTLSSVHVGANSNAINAMTDVIEVGKMMGSNVPEIEVIEYNSDKLASSMSALNGAWKIASASNTLVILQPSNGKQIIMTQSADLIEAYQMHF